MICKKCGKDNPQGRKFCTGCGSQMIMACPSCGNEITKMLKFCPICGLKIEYGIEPDTTDKTELLEHSELEKYLTDIPPGSPKNQREPTRQIPPVQTVKHVLPVKPVQAVRQTVQPKPQNPKKKPRIVLIILGIVSMFLLAGVGGYWFYELILSPQNSLEKSVKVEMEKSREQNEDIEETDSEEEQTKEAEQDTNVDESDTAGTAPAPQESSAAPLESSVHPETTAYTPVMPGAGNTSDYLLPLSQTTYLNATDLAGLGKDQLRLARNEIYARHGRMFTAQDLQDYFNGKSWYKGTVAPDKFDESVLNEYEKANLDVIKLVEGL